MKILGFLLMTNPLSAFPDDSFPTGSHINYLNPANTKKNYEQEFNLKDIIKSGEVGDNLIQYHALLKI